MRALSPRANWARIHDAVVLKTLATRKIADRRLSLEYMLIGLATALALAAGGIAGVVCCRTDHDPAVGVFADGCAVDGGSRAGAATVGIGLVGTWRILGLKAAPVLRTV